MTAGALAQFPVGAAATAPAIVAPTQKNWPAPDISKLLDDKYAQMVRHGKALMVFYFAKQVALARLAPSLA